MRFVPSVSSWCFVAGPVFHKSLEVEVGYGSQQGFSIGWRFNTKGDHAGLRGWLDIFKFFFSISIQDTRHWNYLENRFYNQNEEDRIAAVEPRG